MSDFFKGYDIDNQKCPICNRIKTVGRLSGGQSPTFFCKECEKEFKIKNTKEGITATIKTFTISGIKAEIITYKYNKEMDRFFPV